MPPIESLIGGADKLVKIFGRWPSFHDAEMIEFSLSRSYPGTKKGQSDTYLMAKIYLREMTSEIDGREY